MHLFVWHSTVKDWKRGAPPAKDAMGLGMSALLSTIVSMAPSLNFRGQSCCKIRIPKLSVDAFVKQFHFQTVRPLFVYESYMPYQT